MAAKGPEAFRTISEASQEVGVPSHVLRFWESRFSFIRPMKRAGGRRFYRPQDLQVLRGVRALLHDEGYTIKGVQKLHKEQGVARLVDAAGAPPPGRAADPPAPTVAPPAPAFVLNAAARGRLAEVLDDLETAKSRIDGLLDRGVS